MIDIKTKISSFFIFNSNFGTKEGDELKKILFFHPSQTAIDARKMQVGLCEAVVKFMSTFSSEPCEALQTQTKRYIFYQPEKGFWMVLVVRIPYTTKALSAIGESKAEVVEPTVMSDLLVSAYKMFKMFMGAFKDISIEEVYTTCEEFFTPYILSRNLSNDISDVIQGIHYLPLDKNSFFRVMCFIDLLEVNYPDFKCISFVYNDQLIWNGLSNNDMLTLYQYIVLTLLPKEVEKEIQGDAIAAAQRHGRFISPPDGIHNREDLQKFVKVYLMREDDTETKQYYLVIYRTLSATVSFTIDEYLTGDNETSAISTPSRNNCKQSLLSIPPYVVIPQLLNTLRRYEYRGSCCLFGMLNYSIIDKFFIKIRESKESPCFFNTTLEIETFRSLDAFMGPQLSAIASTISEQCTMSAIQNMQLASEHKFVYFNRLNSAFKTSHPINKLVPSTAIKPEVLSIIAGIHSDKKSLGNYGEIIIKIREGYWITGKKSNEREFYVIIQEKNATLKEISDEVKKICEAQMKGVFFYPV